MSTHYAQGPTHLECDFGQVMSSNKLQVAKFIQWMRLEKRVVSNTNGDQSNPFMVFVPKLEHPDNIGHTFLKANSTMDKTKGPNSFSWYSLFKPNWLLLQLSH